MWEIYNKINTWAIKFMKKGIFSWCTQQLHIPHPSLSSYKCITMKYLPIFPICTFKKEGLCYFEIETTSKNNKKWFKILAGIYPREEEKKTNYMKLTFYLSAKNLKISWNWYSQQIHLCICLFRTKTLLWRYQFFTK